MADEQRQRAEDGGPPKRTVQLTLAYDGTPFVGWQRQPVGVSIQGLLEEALGRIDGSPVTVIGAGRTDAGVHASGQVASATISTALDVATLRRALNAILPADIRVLGAAAVDPSFHARYSAVAKTYRYAILAGGVVLPFEQRYCWHVSERLDADRIAAAAPLFEGEHDFAAFCSAGSSVKTTTRLVTRSRIVRVAAALTPFDVAVAGGEGVRLIFEVTATGFLRHMVRAMVGTLVEIGLGRRDAVSIPAALHSAERADAGPTAPARGLCLVQVHYANP